MDSMRNIIAKVNKGDAPRLRAFANRVIQEHAGAMPLISSFVKRLGFLDAEQGPGHGLEPGGLDLDPAGAEAFVSLLRQHPAIVKGRRLPVGIAIFGDADADPALFSLRREASAFLLVGALAVGTLGLPAEQYAEALVYIAAGPDALSAAVRKVLLGRPLPDPPPGEPEIPDWLKQMGRVGQALDMRTCVAGLTSALGHFSAAAAGSLATSFATGITDLDPHAGCAGSVVAIYGSGFGASQPPDVDVYFPNRSGGCTKATVTAWSDNVITAVSPADVGIGCVGFVRRGAGGAALAQAASTLADQLQHCIGMAAAGASARLRERSPLGIVPCPPCLPADQLGRVANHFSGGPPIIDGFFANGGVDVTVVPNTVVTLSWAIRNATVVTLTRVSPDGPFVSPPAPLPATGSLGLGPFIGNQLNYARYRLTADNGCGDVVRIVTVYLRALPHLAINRIEVVQAIQRPDNSVRLVAEKWTAVRVYVESGIAAGFDNGYGEGVQPDVTGTLAVWPDGANQGFDGGMPLNGNGVIVVHDSAGSGKDPNDSLIFRLRPEQVNGTMRFEAHVYVKGHENDPPGEFKALPHTTTVIFLPQPTQEIQPIRVGDLLLGLPPPTLAQFNDSLQGAITRYPIADQGFTLRPPRILFTNPLLGHILTTGPGWMKFLLDLATWYLMPALPAGVIAAALVPSWPQYSLGGLGTPRVGPTVPAFVVQAGYPAAFAHEMGHAYGSRHSTHAPWGTDPLMDANSLLGFDPTMSSVTEVPGMDVSREPDPARVIPDGTPDIMNWVGGEWPAITFWDFIFDRIPI